jgi:hypothetical protein
MKTPTIAPRPGHNCRLQVSFSYDKRGHKVAYRVSPTQFYRNLRIPLADALLFVAQGQADEVPYRKMRGAL